jgi:hypothetical protein
LVGVDEDEVAVFLDEGATGEVLQFLDAVVLDEAGNTCETAVN